MLGMREAGGTGPCEPEKGRRSAEEERRERAADAWYEAWRWGGGDIDPDAEYDRVRWGDG